MPAIGRTFRSAQRPFAARAERAAVLHAQGLARLAQGRSAESASVSCADTWNHPLVRFVRSSGLMTCSPARLKRKSQVTKLATKMAPRGQGTGAGTMTRMDDVDMA